MIVIRGRGVGKGWGGGVRARSRQHFHICDKAARSNIWLFLETKTMTSSLSVLVGSLSLPVSSTLAMSAAANLRLWLHGHPQHREEEFNRSGPTVLIHPALATKHVAAPATARERLASLTAAAASWVSLLRASVGDNRARRSLNAPRKSGLSRQALYKRSQRGSLIWCCCCRGAQTQTSEELIREKA